MTTQISGTREACCASCRRQDELFEPAVLIVLAERLRVTGIEFSAADLERPPPGSRSQRRRVLQVAQELEHRYAEAISVDLMAQAANLSRYHFIRVFHALTGETPRQRLIGIRLRAAADRLIATRQPITKLALEVGFNDISHFYATFRRAFGMSPRAWRREAEKGSLSRRTG
ncbi:helix-turn-helix domain-containing protein [Peristeroidobacter agariperforans]|uniref:helix-turn-helix domain-containing protein n=1 Tax=Peristeroidobacter agariperforans TaxID=268404 RepID=UPI00101C304D|nr:AraC family transcriptional regulator [Peristeroidobacter agariperforans]